jgi:hypothetical protein
MPLYYHFRAKHYQFIKFCYHVASTQHGRNDIWDGSALGKTWDGATANGDEVV